MIELALYRAVSSAGGPLIRLYLRRRLAIGKEDPTRLAERLGRSSRLRPPGPLIWIHAASVGESLSMLPLIVRLRESRPDHAVLLTTGTVTSARLMAKRLPEGAFHQYVPVDRAAYVRRFLDHWRPDLALWAESELWPNLLLATAGRGIPMVLVNARISLRSFARWQRHPRMIARLLAGFVLCLGQTEADARRLAQLGAPRTACVGNLKFAAPPLPADPDRLAALEEMLAGRPRWLAASTHPGEEVIAAAVHRSLKPRFPALLTTIVPRHPERGGEVAALLRRQGLIVARRSAGQPARAETDVYLADTLGELGLFYRALPIAFIGKSLTGRGGQNPLEAAQLGCAVVHGPHMNNFTEIAERLAAAGGAITVDDEPALSAAIGRLLEQPTEARRLAAAAQAVATSESEVLDAVLAALAEHLPAWGQGSGDAGA